MPQRRTKPPESLKGNTELERFKNLASALFSVRKDESAKPRPKRSKLKKK